MPKEVMIWMLMYTDWIVKNLTSGNGSFLIPKQKYQKISEKEEEIGKVLLALPEVDAVTIESDGINVFLV